MRFKSSVLYKSAQVRENVPNMNFDYKFLNARNRLDIDVDSASKWKKNSPNPQKESKVFGVNVRIAVKQKWPVKKGHDLQLNNYINNFIAYIFCHNWMSLAQRLWSKGTFRSMCAIVIVNGIIHPLPTDAHFMQNHFETMPIRMYESQIEATAHNKRAKKWIEIWISSECQTERVEEERNRGRKRTKQKRRK